MKGDPLLLDHGQKGAGTQPDVRHFERIKFPSQTNTCHIFYSFLFFNSLEDNVDARKDVKNDPILNEILGNSRDSNMEGKYTIWCFSVI